MSEKKEQKISSETLQKVILGYKKNGDPRALYDAAKGSAKMVMKFLDRDEEKSKKKKKKGKGKGKNKQSRQMLAFYLGPKKKKGKHWHI